ncbi:MAG: type I DNA topoisomerase [Candidatus Spyradenecus sp.]
MAAKKPHALVIVESPSKAKKIATYVDSGTEVLASVGHIRDLPVFNLGVSITNHFEPNYIIPNDKKKVVEELQKATKRATTVYLASDPDREGESIAWHLYEVLKDVPGERKFYRVRYNEVTKGAVLNALANPTAIDQHLVDAQQARRIEDRLSGFKISKLLSNSVRGAKSAGRVQSVALRLIVDRERAVQGFKTTPYWLLGAELGSASAPFLARLAALDGKAPKFLAYGKEVQGIADKAAAEGYFGELNQPGRAVKVCSVERKTLLRKPQPPFITSTLQQAAATHLGYSPDQTMRLAQALYEEGLITYMRTDGYTVSASIRGAVEAEIAKLFGRECVPEKPNFYGNKVKNAQEAHEPIRPTDVTRRTLTGVEPQQAKLYDLIWKRFVASQMASAKFERTTATFEPTLPPPLAHAYRFSASAQKVLFKGFLNVWAYTRPEEEEEGLTKLPALEVGQVVPCVRWLLTAKETQPPARFNEASLVRALEENGIGRPSTYASIIRTLLARDYVKSGRNHVLTPTEMGVAATDFLLGEMPDFVNVEFTAQMEDALDKVADGSRNWEQEVADFYAKLTEWLAADLDRVRAILDQLKQVTAWREPTRNKTGKISWSDQGFYEEMCEAVAKGEAPSKAQLATLTRVAVSYRDQLPGLTEVVGELPPAIDKAAVEALFDALAGRALNGWEQRFTTSLKDQFERKGDLSPKQLAILTRLAHPETDEERQDNEVPARELVAALSQVTTWNKPVKRGRKVYDDQEFCQSLTTQLDTKHFLTARQFEALKKTVRVYQAQIPNYTELAAKHGIKAASARPRRASPKKRA